MASLCERSRTSLAGALVLTVFVGLLQALGLPVSTASAAVHDVRAATWNMAGGVDKWKETIPKLVAQRGISLLALQEHPDTEPSAQPDGAKELTADGLEYVDIENPAGVAGEEKQIRVLKYVWRDPQFKDPASGEIKQHYVYFGENPALQGDVPVPGEPNTNNENRAFAIVTDRPVGGFDATWSTHANRAKSPRPAFGVKLGDTWFYSIHSDSKGGGKNDAAELVKAVKDRHVGANWAVLGDFNRTVVASGRANIVRDLTKLGVPDGEYQITRPNVYTFPTRRGGNVPNKEYDYLVSSPLAGPYKAYVQNDILTSDHYPVVFSTIPVLGETEDPARPCRAPRMAPGDNPNCGTPEAIVSMGDSYISGEAGRWQGNADTSPQGDVWGTDRGVGVYGDTSYNGGSRCDRSDVAPIKSTTVEGVSPENQFNIACSGAETRHIVSESFKGERPQVEQLADIAKNHDINLVVLSIGGNDLDFSGIIKSCTARYLIPLAGQPCNGSDEMKKLPEKLNATQAKVEDAVKKIRSTLEGAGQGDAQVIIQGYPNPLTRASENRYKGSVNPYDRYHDGGCPILNSDLDWAFNSLIPQIANMSRTAARNSGASYMDTQGAFAGHELCSASAKQATKENSSANPLPAADAEWVRWIPYLLDSTKDWRLGSQGDQQEAIHPNAYGQQALGACLTQFAAQLDGSERREFTCGNTPGPDGGNTTSSAQVVAEAGGKPLIIRNAANGEVLSGEYSGSKWAITSTERDSNLQRWKFTDSAVPELQNIYRGGKLRGDGGKNWQWASIVTPTTGGWVWNVPDAGAGDGTATFQVTQNISNPWPEPPTTRVFCLAQSSRQSTHWVSLDPCDKGEKNQRWTVTRAVNEGATENAPDESARTGFLQSAKDSLVADVDNAIATPGTRVKALGKKDQQPAQTWTLRRAPDGLWEIVSKLDNGPRLSHDAGSHEARLASAESGGADALWKVVDAGSGWATVRNGDLCLTAGANDETLKLQACQDGAIGQRWKLPGVTPDKPAPAAPPLMAWEFKTDGSVRSRASNKCLDVDNTDGGGRRDGGRVHLWGCDTVVGSNQQWTAPGAGDGTVTLVNQGSGMCLQRDPASPFNVHQSACKGNDGQRWAREGDLLRNRATGMCLKAAGTNDGSALGLTDCPTSPPVPSQTGDAGNPFDDAADTRGPKPAVGGPQSACRPDGITPTAGVDTRYCDVYDGQGREWLGSGDRTRRVVGYFTGWRSGEKGDPKYLVSNIPWSKVTHLNYAFAEVGADNRISLGDGAKAATQMTWPGDDKAAVDPSLPYQGHFNLLTKYKKQHPQVKTLISVGGWTATKGFYKMATNEDGTVNTDGINTFAASVADFLAQYGFDGVDIDYEYPTAMPNTGNPDDWGISNPRRKGLQAGYNALMKALREKLDNAGSNRGRYYLLTSAGSSSGYLVRGLENHQALAYQDFVNVMTYDFHGTWNNIVGPQAPLYDEGRDPELVGAGIYDTTKNPEYQKIGYFNTDWAYHYYRGALQPGRINLGMPYYTRGWRDVQGGVGNGLWGTAAMPDQNKCPTGTGGNGPVGSNGTRMPCGAGAVGVDNIWHDLNPDGSEMPAGSNPLWHAKNLQDGRTPGYLKSYGVDPAATAGKVQGTYARNYSDAMAAAWLWNDQKKVFLSTEDELSIKAKTQYVVDNQIGGVMLWELGGDYQQRPGGEYGMGYTLTSQIDQQLRGTAAYGARRANQDLPGQVLNVKAELTGFYQGGPGVDPFYPLDPLLRITNNSGKPLPSGTEFSFDVPTSAAAVFRDSDGKDLTGVQPSRSGPNTGGLKTDFHRVTVALEACQEVPAGKSIDVPFRYYLPITGPANFQVKIGGQSFGIASDNRRGTTQVEPPTAGGAACKAYQWNSGRSYLPGIVVLWKGHHWKPLWSTKAEPGTAEPNGSKPWKDLGETGDTDASGLLPSDTTLNKGDSITSSNGWKLSMQDDGDLVLANPQGQAQWRSNTIGTGHHASMLKTGDFVLYAEDWARLRHTNTDGNPGAVLAVQNDGNLVLYRTDGSAPWARQYNGNTSFDK
ncbi:glycosyl hydrolase family 18 protein [Kitasatospora sp. NPDC086801]|uniref:glycosyl hydrolase family 18 protein n=1 Tax=Kitasatospora sp. NPDC086801 TaxID=3364066 RepID=UPI003827BE44